MTGVLPRVLGIDPGSYRTGYGIIEKRASQFIHVTHGVISLKSELPLPHRLKQIYAEIIRIIQIHGPKAMAIEEIFHHKSSQSALKLGHVRGISILAGINCDLEIYEYAPLAVKKAVVGYGRAAKEQVQQMIKILLGLPEIPQEDAADALAIAVCHLNQNPLLLPIQQGTSWGQK